MHVTLILLNRQSIFLPKATWKIPTRGSWLLILVIYEVLQNSEGRKREIARTYLPRHFGLCFAS